MDESFILSVRWLLPLRERARYSYRMEIRLVAQPNCSAAEELRCELSFAMAMLGIPENFPIQQSSDSTVNSPRLLIDGNLVRPCLPEHGQIDCEFVIDNGGPDGSGLAEHNPLCRIPVLLLDDGGSLFDSRVIVEYLDNFAPNNRPIPPAAATWKSIRGATAPPSRWPTSRSAAYSAICRSASQTSTGAPSTRTSRSTTTS